MPPSILTDHARYVDDTPRALSQHLFGHQLRTDESAGEVYAHHKVPVQHFALFEGKGGSYWLGMEDKTKTDCSDFDYNDTSVSRCRSSVYRFCGLLLRMAMARAFFVPMITTSFLPRVMPV